MKKFIFFFSCLSMIHEVNAKLDINRPEAQPPIKLSPLKNAFRTIGDFLGDEGIGFQALKKENEKYIRSIIDELQMEEYCIEIRGFSNAALMNFGRVNACVIPSLIFGKQSHSYLFISEDWFETLTEHEKQTLVRHELMHLKYNHGKKKIGFILLSYLGIMMILGPIVQNSIINCSLKENKQELYRISSSFTCLLIWILSTLKYSRSCEKEADIQAAKSMKNSQGLVDLMTTLKENIEDPESKFKIKRFFNNLFKPIKKLFYTHPALDERISYAKQLQY